MNLDLDELLGGWESSPDEPSARLVTGRDGVAYVQLRVDLGVLQMRCSARPDGTRYRTSTALEYVGRRRRARRPLAERDWAELERELQQYNLRRIAFTSLADAAMNAEDEPAARTHYRRALKDVNRCIQALVLLEHHQAGSANVSGSMLPTLLFNRARIRARIRTIDRDFEKALLEIERGLETLTDVFERGGFDEAQIESDPGVSYLRQLARLVRAQGGIGKTLREQLQEAIDNDDFERAAELHEALERRTRRRPRGSDSA